MSSEVPLSNGVSGVLSSRDEAHRSQGRAGRRQLGLEVQIFQSESPFQAVKGHKERDDFFILVEDTAWRAEVFAPKSS